MPLDAKELALLARKGLVAEIERLNALLAQIEEIATNGATVGLSPPKAKRHRRAMTPGERKAHAERMKKFWAERKKQQKAEAKAKAAV